MNVPFVNFVEEYNQHKEALDRAYFDVMGRGDYILRQDVEQFEKNMAEFVGTKYAIGVNSGTDALFLMLHLLNLVEGDEVITVGHTFHATVEAIVHAGGKPVLVNVGDDGMMDIEEVKKAITPKTRAIIPVHLMGDMVDMKKLTDHCAYLAVKEKHLIVIIEDACQALGSERDGKRAGSWGFAGAFSHYPAKILGTAGDAGCITTNDGTIASDLKDLRNHFKYNPGEFGFNSRLDNIHAAFLNAKFPKLNWMIERRQEIADIYNEKLKDIEGLTLPTIRKGRVYQDYIIRTKERERLEQYLHDNGIQTMRNNYDFPVACPKPEKTVQLENETLRIPCNETLTDEQVNYVADKINEFYRAIHV